MMINIRCLHANRTELEFHLAQRRPHVVLFQETWLNVSHEEISLTEYRTISRRDRKEEENRGGILTLARKDFNKIVHVENAASEERSWHFLHLGPEVILLGNWYRPGSTIHDSFEGLNSDLQRLLPECTGIILTGDLNIHHVRWLRYSNGNSQVGTDLRLICENHDLQQLVSEPTRGQYLLDLYLTDIAGSTVTVGPKIADHSMIIADIPLIEPQALEIRRKRFNIRRARCKELKKELGGDPNTCHKIFQ